ncbi:aminoglycoside phosphotransferase family protein, partial [Candidatus Parcubacteria bacterium]|nr:aminoglycoside phosphotransferase family protein [Candidatus Parcubacteria bacterium]
MNRAYKLFDKEFVLKILEKKVLPRYPDFSSVRSFTIQAYKDNIWEGDTYHVVTEYRTKFLTKDGKTKTLPIFCSAHSDEPRKNVYDSLKFLWDSGFGRGYFTIPHPLFYSNYFKATFYRGVEGHNLYEFIRTKNLSIVEIIVPKAAEWLAKLHGLDARKARNFNKMNSRIETVVPGVEHILSRIQDKHPEYYSRYQQIYDILVKKEKDFLCGSDKQWLVHGDAHPENVIKMGNKKIAVIDFTDICLSDFARDLGSFLQQLEFMVMRKIKDLEYADKLKKMFLDSYFEKSREKLNKEVKARINNYYNW